MIKNLEARLSQTRTGTSPIAATGRSKVGQIVRVRNDSRALQPKPRNYETVKVASISRYAEAVFSNSVTEASNIFTSAHEEIC